MSSVRARAPAPGASWADGSTCSPREARWIACSTSRASLDFDRHAVAPKASIWRDSARVGRFASTTQAWSPGTRRWSSRSSRGVVQRAEVDDRDLGLARRRALRRAGRAWTPAATSRGSRPRRSARAARGRRCPRTGRRRRGRVRGSRSSWSTPPLTLSLSACVGKRVKWVSPVSSPRVSHPDFTPRRGRQPRTDSATIRPCTRDAGPSERLPDRDDPQGYDESETAVSLFVINAHSTGARGALVLARRDLGASAARRAASMRR